MDKILRESRESVRFMISEPLFKELYDYLKEKKIFIDEFNFKNNEIHGEINHGDWKHEHAYANLCINKFMNDRNIFVEHESWTTESDGSDCYSAKHIWKLFSSDPDLEVDEPIELELQEPVYMKEDTNISNRNFTTVDDIISGMIGNMSDESIDTDLKIFSKIAKALGIKDYTKLVVFIDTNDEYNLKYYSNLFNSVSDLYKAKDIKIYTLDSFVCVVEAHRGGNVFIYSKSETDLDAILDAIDKYNDEPMNESKSDKPLYVIKDSHGNQLSAPNSDDGELWDRVSSMEARGRRGLCVVAYTGKQMNESSDLELSDDEKDDILMTVGAGFETGHHVAKDFEEFKDTFNGISNAKAGWNYYQELVNLGPAGFYAEHKDDYQFDDMFIAEYGEVEDEDNGPDFSNGKVQATAYTHVDDMPYWSKNMSAKDIQHVLNPDINQVKAGVIPFPLVNVQTKKEYGFYIYNPKTNKYVYTNDWDKRDTLLKKFGHINESKSIKEENDILSANELADKVFTALNNCNISGYGNYIDRANDSVQLYPKDKDISEEITDCLKSDFVFEINQYGHIIVTDLKSLSESKSIKESKDMYCVYFEQDGYEQLEFTGTIDECNKYISDIQSEQEAEFGDEAPERFIKKLDESNVSSVYTEEVTDLVHDDWKQPEADVAVFVKGDYRIQKVENDGKETWEVLHYKGDTNEGTSMGKCDSIEAAKKKADDDAKKSEPKTVTEDYDSKTTEFNDQYFPRVDLTEYEYYKHGDYEYAYDITHGLLIQLFKDEDEVAEFGIDKAPFRELDIVGLSRDIWADTQARDDYLTQYETEVEAEVQAELQNLI